jgi:hypothetical protein
MSNHVVTPMSFKDKLAIFASIVAVTISITTFFRDNLFGQHILKASVVAIDCYSDHTTCKADILLVNPGKHAEVLFKAQFIFSGDLSRGGGQLSKESVGPVVLESGKAIMIHLETAAPTVATLREQGLLPSTQNSIHLGVIFDALTPAGELREDSKIFRITAFTFSDTGLVGSKPRPGDSVGLIDLL